MDAPQPPRRRLRLWQLIVGSLLALVIVLVAFAFVLRASGAAELKRTIADLTARGYPMTLEALRAGAVDGDPLVQGPYDRWWASRAPRPSREKMAIDFTKAGNDPAFFSWIDRGEPAPRQLQDLVAAHAPEFADLRQAIRTARLRVGLGAKWIPLIEGKMGAQPDLLALRESTFFLRASALTGDPLAFADLVALVDGLKQMRGSHDSMIACGLTMIADKTMVELEVLEGFKASAADDWLGRRPDLRLQHAEALKWELGLTAFTMREALDDLMAPVAAVSSFTQREGFAGISARCRDWMFMASDLANGFQVHAGLADHLLDPARPLAVPSTRSLSASGGFIAQDLSPILGNILSTEAECRSRHVAVLIRREAIRRGSLPSDNVAVFADKACGSWMEGGESAYWLAYERLSPTRFRVAVDPKRPLPSILAGLPERFNAANLNKTIIGSALGQPADKALTLSLQGANTEIVVPDFPPKQEPSVPGLTEPVPPKQPVPQKP